MIIFTSICANYVHKARALARTVKANIPDATMILCLTEREIDPRIPEDCFDEIVLAKDAWAGDFDQFIFKHAIVEASTAVKGRFFQYLLEHYPQEDKFVYLDPDVYVYSDFTELREELDRSDIVLCPHLLKPGNIDMEISSMAHGVYNLGFLAVRRSEESKRCIDWWAERLSLFCYDDIPRGIFTDQGWFDLAPCFFDVKIFKHHGYDFAPWSLLDCGMTEENGNYFVMGDPLRFIHFSGFGASTETCMERWLPPGEHPFRTLYAQYSQVHADCDSDGISKTPWSYATFASGEAIDGLVRQFYRDRYWDMLQYGNPFQRSNAFYRDLMRAQAAAEAALHSDSKLRRYWAKAKQVYREEGFAALMKKACKKIYKKLFGKA